MNAYRALAVAALVGLGAILASAGEWSGDARTTRPETGALAAEQSSTASARPAPRFSGDRFLFTGPQAADEQGRAEQLWDRN